MPRRCRCPALPWGAAHRGARPTCPELDGPAARRRRRAGDPRRRQRRRDVLAHPLGELAGRRRRSCPLGIEIDRVGTARALRRRHLRHHRRSRSAGRRNRVDAVARRALRPGRVPRPHRGGEALHAVVRAVPRPVSSIATDDFGVPASARWPSSREWETVYLAPERRRERATSCLRRRWCSQAALRRRRPVRELRRRPPGSPGDQVHPVDVAEPAFTVTSAAADVHRAPPSLATFTEAARRGRSATGTTDVADLAEP